MSMIKRVLMGLLLTGMSLMAAEQKVVYDLTTGNADLLEKGLVRSINGLLDYYEANKIDHKIVVVISGKAYKYFVADLKDSPYKGKMKVSRAQKRLAPALQRLSKAGVEFDMCQAGMKARGIKRASLYPYVKAELNKSVYLVKWQNEGYAYLPVH